MKKVYFGTNLKMYKNIQQTVDYLKELEKGTELINREEYEFFVIPSYISLPSATNSVSQDKIRIGAQNMGWEEEGQYTGEISPRMLDEISVKLVMVGHSERRHVFRETDEEENKKVLCGLKHGFTMLLCIGETENEKEFGISNEVLRSQLIKGLHCVRKEEVKKIWIAYEPVWAIGVNGKPASEEYANSKHKVIKECLIDIFGECGLEIPVLYGGSVNPQNADSLIKQEYIDGLFVGRSAWNAEQFSSLIFKSIDTLKKHNNKKVM